MKDFNKALKNGEVLVGISSSLHDPVVTEMLGYGGFDWVMLNVAEASTSPYGRDLENLIRAAYAADIIPMVKVTNANYPEISKALDLGAKGVFVSIVRTKEECMAAVNAAYFPPLGNRTANPEIKAAHYGVMPWAEYYKHANEQITVAALIEDMQGIENMEDIISVEGLNGVMLGEFDLIIRIGEVGDHEVEAQVLKYKKKMAELAKKKGVAFIDHFRDVDSAIQCLENGCQILIYPDDITLLKNEMFRVIKDARKAIKKFS